MKVALIKSKTTTEVELRDGDKCLNLTLEEAQYIRDFLLTYLSMEVDTRDPIAVPKKRHWCDIQ